MSQTSNNTENFRLSATIYAFLNDYSSPLRAARETAGSANVYRANTFVESTRDLAAEHYKRVKADVGSRLPNFKNKYGTANSEGIDGIHKIIARRLDNVLKLRSFGELKLGWNGYQSLIFEQQLIDYCITLLHDHQLLLRQPDIFPTGRGSIQFEYEKHDGRYLEMEIFPDHKIAVYAEFPNTENIEAEDMSLEAVLELIKRFDA